jgi:hypothetical protein
MLGVMGRGGWRQSGAPRDWRQVVGLDRIRYDRWEITLTNLLDSKKKRSHHAKHSR